MAKRSRAMSSARRYQYWSRNGEVAIAYIARVRTWDSEYLFVHIPGGLGPTLPPDEAIRRDPRWPATGTRAAYSGARGNLFKEGSHYEITACHLDSRACLIRLVPFCVSRPPEWLYALPGAWQDQGDFGGSVGLGVDCRFPVVQQDWYGCFCSHISDYIRIFGDFLSDVA